MSATAGHVTRKDGRIVALPEKVRKTLAWLTGVAVAMPVIMLLVAIGAPQWVFPWWGAAPLLLVFGIPSMVLVGVLVQGQKRAVAYGISLLTLQWLSMTLAPVTQNGWEMLLTRGMPIAGVLATVFFLKADLHYNLRPFWYSLQAMQEFQRQMAMMKAKRDAKKQGREFDPAAFGGADGKVVDVQAAVREMSARTGKDIPTHMQGFAAKPGYRDQARDRSRSAGTQRQQRRKRR